MTINLSFSLRLHDYNSENLVLPLSSSSSSSSSYSFYKNDSDDNISSNLFFLIFQFFLTFSTIGLNSLIIFIIIVFLKKKSFSNFLFLSSAIADLLIGVLPEPLMIAYTLLKVPNNAVHVNSTQTGSMSNALKTQLADSCIYKLIMNRFFFLF
jgi:hypothetical protein